MACSSRCRAVEHADPGGAVELVPRTGVEVAVQRPARPPRRWGDGLGAVHQDHRARGVGHLHHPLHGVHRAQRVGDVGDGHDLRARPRAAARARPVTTAPSSSMGATRSRAPFSSQSICQGTMLEWCSRPVMSTSSPAPHVRPAAARGHEVDALGGAAGEDDLLRGGGAEEALHLRARGLVGVGGLHRELVHAAVDVGVVRLVDRALGVDHRPRLLGCWPRCRGRPAGWPCTVRREDREVGAHGVHVERDRGHARGLGPGCVKPPPPRSRPRWAGGRAGSARGRRAPAPP